jgi:hypothetical protein
MHRSPGLPGSRLATVAATILAGALPAHAALDAVTDRQVGGVFSNACGDRSQVMIRLYGDVLDVERAGVAIKASRLQSDRKPPAGAPIADFSASVRGQVKGSGVVDLTITHNARGLYARIDGSEAALAPLGPGVMGQTLRHCDPNRNALPGAAPAVIERSPADLLKEARFRAAYAKVLGPLAREPWITRLQGPAPPLREVALAGRPYTLAASCKTHDCYDHNLVLLWNPGGPRLIGFVQQSGRKTLLGAPAPHEARELERLWTQEFRRK